MVGEDERTGAWKRKKEEEKTRGKKRKTKEKVEKESEDREKKEAKMEREEELLGRLEGMREMEEEEDDCCEVFNEEVDATSRVTTTLRDHFSHWKKTGAPHFSLSVIKEGYKIRLEDCPKGMKYEEKNNKSYEKHEAFANEAVAKMEKIKVVERVKKEDCRFINPLTVAVNNDGKRRLCIDLSRSLNKYVKAKKFKIRSHKEVAEMVEESDYGFGFDLRSYYHQVPIHKDSQNLLCFKIKKDGRWEYYMFRMLPFGFNDAYRCVTKMMRSLLVRWRSWGARTAEIHIDDGIVFVGGKEKAIELLNKVRKDLQD